MGATTDMAEEPGRKQDDLARALGELQRRNELILEAAGEGIYGLDTEGLTTFVNPAAARLLGWPAEELIGAPMHAVLHHKHADGSPYPREECPIYMAFKDGRVHRVDDEVFWRKDGTSFPVEYTSTPIREDGKSTGAVVVFRDISRLRKALAEVEALKNRLQDENVYLQEEIKTEYNFDEIVGSSPEMQRVLKAIETVAPTDANVLIGGETGTGKELVARAVHSRSARHGKPLIKVNCASIPRDLFESEFFGHVKGAFTGALRDRAGRFQLADRGTLFLDEVGEIPLEMQSKLLRVLQEGEYERVGDERTGHTDVRVICATNRDLEVEIREGRFRRDLYYRINVFPIQIPPLRRRRGDLPLLAQHFLKSACTRMNRPRVKLSERHVRLLESYPWPGNARELQNVIERAVIVSEPGRLCFEMPALDSEGGRPERASEPGSGIVSDDEMRRRERDNILAALEQTDWRVYGEGGAAELLGIRPTTLASRVKKMGLEKPR